MSPDIINALFISGGALSIFINVYYLYKDKKVRGVHWVATLYFALWSAWSLIFYVQIGQWWSFYSSIVLLLADLVWLGQVVYYNKKEK